MEEDDMVKSRYGNTSYGDEPMRREGLQAHKEVPRASRRLALAAAKRSLTLSFSAFNWLARFAKPCWLTLEQVALRRFM